MVQRCSMSWSRNWFWCFPLILAFGGFDITSRVLPLTTKPLWHIPSKAEVVVLNGRFFAGVSDIKSPLPFRTETGEIIDLWCDPEMNFNPCLSDYGISPQDEYVVGYFIAAHREGGRPVVYYVQREGRYLISPDESRRFLYKQLEVHRKWSNNPAHFLRIFWVEVILSFLLASAFYSLVFGRVRPSESSSKP